MKKQVKEEVKKEEPVIYIGPTIPNRIKQYTVYKGVPASVEELKKEIPELKHLFVNVSKLNESKAKLSDETSYLSVIYNTVASHTQGGIR